MSSDSKSKKAHISEPIFTMRGDNWEPYVMRNMSFWHQHLSSQGVFHHLKDFGVEYQTRQMALTMGGTETHIFLIAGSLSQEGGAILASVLGEAKMNVLEKKYKHEATALLAALNTCLCEVTVEHWRKFCAQYKKFCAALQITAILGRIGLEKLTKRLRELGYEETVIPHLIGVITYPNEHTPLFLSQKELYEIAAKGQKENLSDEVLRQHITKWLAKHAHIPVNFCEEPWTHRSALSQISAFKKGDARENLERLQKEHRERTRKAKETIDSIGDAEVSALAVTISKGTILNEFRKGVFSKVSLLYRPIFKTIALRAGGESWRDCFYLTSEEMAQIIAGEDVALQRKKVERKIVAFFINKEGGVVFLNPKETKAVFDFVGQFRGGAEAKTKITASQSDEIRGFSASPGRVRGPVKIVISSKDFSKVERGDILVAIMTSVDFIPVMERAAAFVTNEGGITSHASIVAREMGKPCIIGAKIATKVLKDGDLVEVDADHGIIKILKKL